uniref:EF-hand domain-containing protein n=1 Tax=Timema tahoe TaxID=61484 RepID=A0A7R9P0D5_9NEOP|nr:unnamed protein product [Timema tahoe]
MTPCRGATWCMIPLALNWPWIRVVKLVELGALLMSLGSCLIAFIVNHPHWSIPLSLKVWHENLTLEPTCKYSYTMCPGAVALPFTVNLSAHRSDRSVLPFPASPHIHQHHREREQDGGYSPMDHNHIVDGVHYSEFDHEAILGEPRDERNTGSVKEAEEFDHLEPEEAKRRLSILVKKMDLDKDGGITRNELHAWILRSFS